MHEVSKELYKVKKWCYDNKVTIILSKSNYMIIKSKRRPVHIKGDLDIAGCTLLKVDKASFVGLQIVKHLTWTEHIKVVNKTIRSKVGIILFRLRHFVPQKNLITII